jgi:acyl-CoA reductase-like NAD-dependent aldehyde dehydrogenase
MTSSVTTETSTQTKEEQFPPPQKQQQEKGKLNTINPASEEVISQYEIMVKEQINEKIRKAQKTFEQWKKDINKRIDCLHDLVAELRKNKENLARMATKEMGFMEFAQKAEKLRVGDPLSDDTDMGPLVNKNSLENIESVVRQSAKDGAHVITGGERIGTKGYFYKPTVIKDASSKMRIAQEEVFGPIAPIITVDNEAEAIKLANDTQYGLGASIWTQDLDKAEKLSQQIQSGLVTVNNIVASDPRVPFGGVKKSGFGRELSRYGMMEFANIKSVRFYDKLVDYHHVE